MNPDRTICPIRQAQGEVADDTALESNAQGEPTPLKVGVHALGSGMTQHTPSRSSSASLGGNWCYRLLLNDPDRPVRQRPMGSAKRREGLRGYPRKGE